MGFPASITYGVFFKMIRRIGLLHTVPFLADMFRELFQRHIPEVDAFHIVDEVILQELMSQGHLTSKTVRRVATQAILAQDGGADLILFTCSSTSPAVDSIRPLIDVPIMKIDDAMAERAVDIGTRIGVITTAKTTERPSVELVQVWAERKGKHVEISSSLLSEAFEARLKGDIESHDRIVRTTIEQMKQSCDVVVLAQASMSHLAPPVAENGGVPILSGPALCIEALKDKVQ